MRSLNLNIVLDRLICHREGDGAGNAEPYLWAIFFKIDRDTVAIEPIGIKGKPDVDKPVRMHFSRGSHGNLSSAAIDIDADGMDAGDNIPIPGDVGIWNTTLKSILMKHPLKPAETLELPGVAGVFYVLMEEDNVPSGAAEAGHQGLNEFFSEKVNRFLTLLSVTEIFTEAQKLTHLTLENAAIQVMKDKFFALKQQLRDEGKAHIVKTIKASIRDPFQLVAAGIDPDDMLGSEMAIITQTELLQANRHAFQNTMPLNPPFIGGGAPAADDGLFTVTGYFHASPYLETVRINDIPAGVKELFIDSTLKHMGGIPQKSFIRAIGGKHNGKPFVIDRFRAIEMIRNGSMRFFVRSAFGGADGVVEIQAHEPAPGQRFAYLKTENNDSTTDNLWRLPDCVMTYVEA